MQNIKLAALTFVAFAFPLVALAQTNSNANLSALLNQLTALEQQIQALTGSSSAAASSTAPASTPVSSSQPNASCPDLSRTLSLGSIGPDVSGLQAYLLEEGYFSGIATGYFGTLTEGAVEKWQTIKGIVSNGDANSTGFGVVGPKTRAAMEAACVPGNSSVTPHKQCIPVSPPNIDCATNWQPVLDANGCATYYQCVISLPSPSSSATTSSSTSTGTHSCPNVQKPTCSGSVTPFQTDANGCVISYQCSI